jgi:hypothetical protein
MWAGINFLPWSDEHARSTEEIEYFVETNQLYPGCIAKLQTIARKIELVIGSFPVDQGMKGSMPADRSPFNER